MRLLGDNIDIRTLSPLTLAFIGDAVYDLMVRERLVCGGNRPVGALNEDKIQRVRCESQSKAASRIAPILTDEERAAFKRGKNAHASTVPKHADKMTYHTATGLEALFGYLYLKGEGERLRELFDLIETEDEKTD